MEGKEREGGDEGTEKQEKVKWKGMRCTYYCLEMCIAKRLVNNNVYIFCMQVILHYQSLNEPAVIRQLISLLNKNTGELIKKKPRCAVGSF